jgi:hypothetical protein
MNEEEWVMTCTICGYHWERPEKGCKYCDPIKLKKGNNNMAINLNKQQKIDMCKHRVEQVRDILVKRKIMEKFRVVLSLDVSGSAMELFTKIDPVTGYSIMQEAIERLYPIAKGFGPTKELDVWVFSDDFSKLNPVTEENFTTYIQDNILKNKPSCLWGGTDYAPVMEAILGTYTKYNPEAASKSILKKFSSMFETKKDFLLANTSMPTYVIHITDGETSNRDGVIKILIKSSHYPVFWQCVGISSGNQNKNLTEEQLRKRFPFLDQMDTMPGRYIDNANFFALNDIHTVDESVLYTRLLTEFPDYWEKAKNKNILS